MRSPLPTSNEVWQQQFRDYLSATLATFPLNSQIVLACSGGIDSMLLLHLFAQLCPNRLRVITIDHQLQENSQVWSELVLQTCKTLNLDCQMVAVKVGSGNVEAAARLARYQVFEQYLQHQDILILGHQQQDQAETTLLRLLQGSGVKGLAAMSEQQKRHFAKGDYQLWRPMLTLSKTKIEAWAQQLGFDFVQDPMNYDIHYDRVWCREHVWPTLTQRFPKMQDAITRTAMLMHDADEILQEVLQQDWQSCIDSQNRLLIEQYQQCSLARQRQLLSAWMQADHQYRPPLAMVQRLQQEVIQAKQDAQSQLHYAGDYFVRFDGLVYRYNAAQWHAFQQKPNHQLCYFAFDQTLEIALGKVQTQAQSEQNHGLSLDLIMQPLSLVARQGGERIHVVGRVGTRPLKKLLQDVKIAPWYRHQIQILMYHNEILGVFTPQGFWLAHSAFCVKGGWLPQILVK